ncbi:MAG: hypothetical protein PHR11_04170 [Candidatus Omnitrophica bacterium]|nr:hypothetical protein [Candidatus Omnitrophota bacterium]
MKKILAVCAAVIFAAGMTAVAYAAAAKPQEKQDDAAVQEIIKKQAMQKARDELNSHEWMVYVTPAPENAGKRITVEEDVLTFSGEGKVVSRELLAKGYPESNYTLSLQEGGVAVWETMQVNESEGLVFFRGELKDGVLTGVMSKQPQKGSKATYYFTTVKPDVGVQQAEPEKEETAKKKSKKKR